MKLILIVAVAAFLCLTNLADAEEHLDLDFSSESFEHIEDEPLDQLDHHEELLDHELPQPIHSELPLDIAPVDHSLLGLADAPIHHPLLLNNGIIGGHAIHSDGILGSDIIPHNSVGHYGGYPHIGAYDAAPQYIQAAPQYIQAAPQYIHAAPQYIHAPPQYIQAAPAYGYGSPALIGGGLGGGCQCARRQCHCQKKMLRRMRRMQCRGARCG